MSDAIFKRVITHLDVVGASGATYRFRLEPGALPAHSGNYLLARTSAGERELVVLGTALSLTNVETLYRKIEMPEAQLEVYVRLNVSRERRESEHRDILGRLPTDVTVIELD